MRWEGPREAKDSISVCVGHFEYLSGGGLLLEQFRTLIAIVMGDERGWNVRWMIQKRSSIYTEWRGGGGQCSASLCGKL